MESELEMVWQTTTSENRQLKEALLENIKNKHKDHSHLRLLIEN